MNNLLLLLLAIFGTVVVLSLVLEKFASPMDDERTGRLVRWIYPLVGLSLVLAALRYFLGN